MVRSRSGPALPRPRALLARARPALLLLLLFLLLPAAVVRGSSSENYCGTGWAHAADNCLKECPTGDDSECTGALGEGYGCYYYTGCTEEAAAANQNQTASQTAWDNDDLWDNQDGLDVEGESDITAAGVNNFCGATWIHAMFNCTNQCPLGFECAVPGERCWAATNCDQPIEALISEIISTMQGPDSTMDNEDADIFGSTVYDLIQELAGTKGVNLVDGVVGKQTLVTRRELQDRYDGRALLGHGRYLNFEIGNVTRRRLPSGSSAVDVSMVVTGDYRPPPYLDLNVIAEDSINRNGPRVVKTLRDRGARAGRDFFNRVSGIEAVAKRDITQRPTRSPQAEPTTEPTGDPVPQPSAAPSSAPSGTPSSTPSRALDQVLMTGSREDLQLGGGTTTSYGFIFNIRTRPDAGAVVLTRFDFYTESTDDVTLELWTRLGAFQGHKGAYDGWDLIAQGTVKGRGIGRYTEIPEEMYEPVSIPGGGGATGIRAFYLTLNSINLVYKIPVYKADSDTRFHASTEDIEIWDGEGILWYPFPDPELKMFWRKPRQYLGAVYYDRLPCRPFSLYGRVDTLPCPLVPTGAPTVPPPTANPTTGPPTVTPTTNPTGMPTTGAPVEGQTPAPVNPTRSPSLTPTVSVRPTPSPTTTEPTFSPVVPMRANLVVTLRNVPERGMTPREGEKFVEILVTFLKRHTEGSMLLEGIDVWHQELVAVDAKEGTWEVEEEEEDKEEGAEGKKTTQVARVAGKTTNRQLLWRKKKRPVVVIPQVGATEITLVVRITFSNLPSHLLGSMAAVAVHEHEQELLALLHEQQAFYTFFKQMDGVACRVIDEVTPTPTMSPSTEEFYEAQLAAEEAALLAVKATDQVDEGVGLGVFLALGIGFLWCCLTAISVAYLLSARAEMEDQRDMEKLLKAEKTNPLGDDAGMDTKDADEKPPRQAAVARGDAECVRARPDDDRETFATESSESSGARGDRNRSTAVRAMENKDEIRNAHRGGGVGAHRVTHDKPLDAVRRGGAVTERLGKSMLAPPSYEERTNQKDGSSGRQNVGKSMVAPPSYEERMNRKVKQPSHEERRKQKLGSSASSGSDRIHEDRVDQLKQKLELSKPLGSSMIGGHSRSSDGRRPSDGRRRRSDDHHSRSGGSAPSSTGHQRATAEVGKTSAAQRHGDDASAARSRNKYSKSVVVTKTDASDLDALERDLARTNKKALKSSMKHRAAPAGKGHRSKSMSPSLSGDKRHGGHNDLRSSGSSKGSHNDDRRSSGNRSSASTRGDHGDSLRSSRSSKGSQDGRHRSRKSTSVDP